MARSPQEANLITRSPANVLRQYLREGYIHVIPWVALATLFLSSVGCIEGNAKSGNNVDQLPQNDGQVDVAPTPEFTIIEEFCEWLLTSNVAVEGITVSTVPLGNSGIETCIVSVDANGAQLPDGRVVSVHTRSAEEDAQSLEGSIILMQSGGVQIFAVSEDGGLSQANWVAISQ